MRATIVSGLIIGMAAAFLWHFSNIWRFGQYLVGEQSVTVRIMETLGLLLILAFGILNLIYEWRKIASSKDKKTDKERH